MKKAVALLMAVLMGVFALIGCGGNAPADTGKKAEPKIDIEEILGHEPTGRLKTILDKGELVYVTSPDFPPSEFVNPEKTGDEQYVGADIELAKYIADQLGVTLVYDIKDFDGVLMSMTEGLSDIAISGLAPKPERAEAMDFTVLYEGISDEDYHGVMVPADKVDQYNDYDDFAGLTVGAQNGSLQEELAKTHLTGAEIKPIVKVSDGIIMLNNGTIDALVIPSSTAEGYGKNYPNLVMSPIKLETDNPGTAAAVPKGEEDLLAVVNYIITDVVDQGLYNQWQKDAKELALSLGIE